MVEAVEFGEVPMSGMSSRKVDSTFGDDQEASLAQELQKMETQLTQPTPDLDEATMSINIQDYLEKHKV